MHLLTEATILSLVSIAQRQGATGLLWWISSKQRMSVPLLEQDKLHGVLDGHWYGILPIPSFLRGQATVEIGCGLKASRLFLQLCNHTHSLNSFYRLTSPLEQFSLSFPALCFSRAPDLGHSMGERCVNFQPRNFTALKL